MRWQDGSPDRRVQDPFSEFSGHFQESNLMCVCVTLVV